MELLGQRKSSSPPLSLTKPLQTSSSCPLTREKRRNEIAHTKSVVSTLLESILLSHHKQVHKQMKFAYSQSLEKRRQGSISFAALIKRCFKCRVTVK